MEARRLKHPRSNWSRTVLVCGKCSKKVGGGFGPKGGMPLAKALLKYLGLKKGRKASVGIIETKCLGVCPKGAVTVIDGAMSGEWILVRQGVPLDQVVDALNLIPTRG